jgi:hypothetical protein
MGKEWTEEWTEQDLWDLYNNKNLATFLIPKGNPNTQPHDVFYGCGHTVTLEISQPFKTIEELALTLECRDCTGYSRDKKPEEFPA